MKMNRILPILFNTDMVRVILEGEKTVTRRLGRWKIIKLNVHSNEVVAATVQKENKNGVRERQRGKKVMVVRARNEKESVSTGDYVHYKCPNCEKKIGSAFHYPFNEYMMEHKFCDECGQRLDWSDNNDLNS